MKSKIVRWGWKLAALCCLLSARMAVADEKAAPMFSEVALAPIVIEAESFNDAPRFKEEARLIAQLSQAATDRAARELVSRRIAGKVVRVASREEGASRVLVTGTIRLPVSIPPNQRGWKAQERDGVFSDASFSVLDAEGRVLAQQTVALQWDEIKWLQQKRVGRHYHPAARPLMNVLQDFVWRSVDYATKNLSQRDWVKDKP